MKLYLVKPDLTYFNEYNDMMREWCDSNTQIAPWFLDKPIPTIEEFAKFVKHLDDCSYGRLDPRFCSSCRTIEKCGFTFVEEIRDPYDENERIRKYRIDNKW